MKNKKKIDILTPCGLIQGSKKTGKVSKTLYTKAGYAMLELWALQNTSKTKETYIFSLNGGLLLARYDGSPDGFPKVTFFEDDENIESFCPGALAAFNN